MRSGIARSFSVRTHRYGYVALHVHPSMSKFINTGKVLPVGSATLGVPLPYYAATKIKAHHLPYLPRQIRADNCLTLLCVCVCVCLSPYFLYCRT
jgi:hypothetical protein